MKVPGPRNLVAIGMLGLSILLPGAAPAAWPSDPGTNLPVCTATGTQDYPRAVSDGAGGAIVTWRDFRPAGSAIFAQRISAGGTVQWTSQGINVGLSGMGTQIPSITPDGAGGAILAWFDWRDLGGAIYAQRIDANGVAMWTANGVLVGGATYTMPTCAIVSDGAGGAIVAWRDMRDGQVTLLAQRVSFEGARQWMFQPDGMVVGAAETLEIPAMIGDGTGGAILAWQQGVTAPDGMSTLWDTYVSRFEPSGFPAWQLPVSSGNGDQYSPALVSDGVDGAIVTWVDTRNAIATGTDLYAQHVTGAGDLVWNWDGEPVCDQAGDVLDPAVTTDGIGGAIVGWRDSRNGATDIFVQRLSANGQPRWAAGGAAVCTAAGDQALPKIVSDGADGAVVAWADLRTGLDIYARRVTADGSPQGPANGVALCTAANDQYDPCLVTDGAGGAIAAWRDRRSGAYDIYAQRFTAVGALGAEPVVATVQDVPNDQGGRIKLSWYASVLDAAPDYGVASYWVWRSVPPNYATKAIAGGAALLAPDAKGAPVPGVTLTTTAEGDKTIFWEFLGSQYASADAGYSYVVPTTSDSLPASNPLTLVRVQARAALGNTFWNSTTASGYSVDNLAPAQPAAFTGQYLGTSTVLHWSRSTATDLAGYRLYRGAGADFVPALDDLVAAQPDTGFVDPVTGAHFYKLCAIDLHGNMSPFATLGPQYASGVDGRLPAMAALAQNAPNPFNPRTTIRFALPAVGPARLAIFDVAGRRVRTLADDTLAAGDHDVVWDGLDDAGHAMPSGTYLARLTAGPTIHTIRMALVR